MRFRSVHSVNDVDFVFKALCRACACACGPDFYVRQKSCDLSMCKEIGKVFHRSEINQERVEKEYLFLYYYSWWAAVCGCAEVPTYQIFHYTMVCSIFKNNKILSFRNLDSTICWGGSWQIYVVRISKYHTMYVYNLPIPLHCFYFCELQCLQYICALWFAGITALHSHLLSTN